jgi:cbb3-type cytochrome oxidase maturation protein
MSVVFVVLPVALVIAVAAVIVFVLQVRRGQFDDLDSPGLRILHDEEATRSHRGPAKGDGLRPAGDERAIDYDRMADLYDEWVRFDEDVPFFVAACRDRPGPVLELMSGTGRLSVPLVQAGVELTCVDYSEPMLERLRTNLRRRGLSARVVRADVREMRFDAPFPTVLLPFHAFAELVDPADRRRALERIRETLVPGGRFLCALHNPRVRLRRVTPDWVSWGTVPRSRGTGTIAVRTRSEHDPATGIVRGEQVFEVRDADGRRVEERRIPMRFALHSREAFENMVSEAGFRVESLVGDYGGSPYDPLKSPYMIWRLVRP